MSRTSLGFRTRLVVTPMEDRLTPSSGVLATAAGLYAVGSRAGQAGTAIVYNADRSVDFTVTPFGSDFTGAVRVALADVNGDGTPDLIATQGAGGTALVKVFDGTGTHAEIGSFSAYENGFTGGVFVAAADLNGDGRAEIVTGADEGGGPRVRVFDGATVKDDGTTPTVLDDFLAIDDPNFRGGVRLALGDITGDGVADLVVGAGFRGGPRVAVFDGASLASGAQVRLMPDFFAFESTLRNGVFASVGDLNHDGRGDLVFGAGPGGAPRVLALDGKAALGGRHSELANFFAGSTSSRQGVQVGTVTDSTGAATIVGTDLATGTSASFTTGGQQTQQLSRTDGGGFACGLPFDDSSFTIGTADQAAAKVTGKYTGSGAGVLATVPTNGKTVTTTTANATVSLNITKATAVTPTTAGTTDVSGLPLRGLTLTGTVTVTIDGGSTVTVPFTGTLRLTENSDGSVSGRLRITADLSQSGTAGLGFALDGKLDNGKLTVGWLVVSDHTGKATGGNYVYQSPSSRKADKIVLTLG